MVDNLNLSPKSQQIQSMFDKISTRYNLLNRLLSFGQDARWRKALIKKIPTVSDSNGVLYDVACGTGDVIHSFLKKRSDYRSLVGFDISEGMLNIAKIQNRSPQTKHILASAEQLPVPAESANCLTIAFGLRNVDDRQKA
ncbi:MAG: class I SAM-dependent methyltransferase, partial [Bdellovibrionota bacterium]